MCSILLLSTPSLSKESLPLKLGIDLICTEKQELLIGKTIALITNQSGLTKNGESNIECLKKIPGITIKHIFSPEHGFYNNHPAGKKINNQQTIHDINVISLYGKQKKPTLNQLKDIDILLYDIQDIGARCYTYISTLGLAMEAAAEANITFMVLDRPNPISTYKKQGPILDLSYKSFIGYYPIPLRYGLTAGELAKKIIKKNWISTSPELIVIDIENWNPKKWYNDSSLKWIAPSPNIPNLETALIYTATVIFEATNISEGRGTEAPFLTIGAPWINGAKLANEINRYPLAGVIIKAAKFTPKPIKNAVNNPKHNGIYCEGLSITITNKNKVNTEKIATTIFKAVLTLYPDQFEIDEHYLNKLWGNDDLSNLFLKAIPKS